MSLRFLTKICYRNSNETTFIGHVDIKSLIK